MATHFSIANMADGYVEAHLRGLRATFLTDLELQNLREGGSRGVKTKEDFEDMRLTLQESDYTGLLQTEVREGGGREGRQGRQEAGRTRCAVVRDSAAATCARGARERPSCRHARACGCR